MLEVKVSSESLSTIDFSINNENIDISIIDETSTIELYVASEGSGGVGIPTGGQPGQFLIKTSFANYQTEWTNVINGGEFN